MHIPVGLVLHQPPGGMLDPFAQLNTTEVNDMRGLSHVDERVYQR